MAHRPHDALPASEYPTPDDEAGRLDSLRRRALIGAPPEPSLDRLVQLVSRALGFGKVGINFVDECSQWTAAGVGTEHGDTAPREQSFCARAIAMPGELLVVPDTKLDAHFADNPHSDDVRFYAGAPLVTRDGHALGALCVFDRAPHEMSAEQRDTLEALAAAVMNEIELRNQLERSEEEARALAAIGEVTRQLARSTSADELHGQICTAALAVSGGDGALLLLRRADGRLESSATSAGIAPLSVGASERLLTHTVCSTGRSAFVSDTSTDGRVSQRMATLYGARSVSVHPIGDGEAGALVVLWRTVSDRLSEHTERLLGVLADEAAVAIERTDLLARLEELSRTDPLTGIANRRRLEDELEAELARASRDGRPLSVAMLDLDRFKDYNDRHGHQAGDRLLKGAAGAWRQTIRQTDLVARYGGEEFVLVLPSCDADEAAVLLDRVLSRVPSGQTCSAGVSVWDGSETSESLLSRADRACYQAKVEGRNRMVHAGTGVVEPDPV